MSAPGGSGLPGSVAGPGTTTPSVRPAGPDDALCLGVLAPRVFLETYAPEGVRPALAREVLATLSPAAFDAALADPASRLFVAEHAPHRVGFVHLVLGAVPPGPPLAHPAEVLRLYVQAPQAGAGLGTRLLARAEAAAAAAGARHVWLTAWVGNLRARAFYAARGYADRGAADHWIEGERFENRLFVKALPAGAVADRTGDADAPARTPAA
ncbi:GNAT family N-acetyltransferase [Piscinibacter sakaiensis]|uniref:tRNA (Guanine37-N1)-methyltransferase/histone acetyltransferase HPA2 n=1 Tax=Piscinibacter sakaiensis TaxID=1547922 RepID=A0A0K8P040_PISS1|nr:GNAT family N-acetyltransferase [Piscinibacter sakaiensis]GAP35998.1 tRNA (guanine37-N1)-methyltransferase/histone acetyltransferase HPA2 [Piscinibacter sakaiensis]